MVFELENETILNKELRMNAFTSHGTKEAHSHDHQHGEGAGHHHTRLIEGLKDCSYLISSGGGWRVVEDLKANNITTLFTDEELIDAAVEKYMKGELKNNADLVCKQHA
jgi:predicted Fe-Mo cluster-binding NifX family protein